MVDEGTTLLPLDAAAAERLRRLTLAHYDAVLAHAKRWVKDTDADDVAQEVFLALARHLDRVTDDVVRPWLLRAATHRAIDAHRRGRVRSTETDDEIAAASIDAARRDELQRLGEAIDRLPLQQKRVVLAKVEETASFAAIARSMKLSEGAVKTHFQRAIESLRSRLGRRTESQRNEIK